MNSARTSTRRLGLAVAGLAILTGLAVTGTVSLAQGQKAAPANIEPFDAKNFDASTHITNEWMPLKPGTRFIYEGNTVEDDGTSVPHRVVINVTDLTKVIGGVRSVVTWDLDYSDGELVEAELAFFAQDKEGNVWRMGEYPEEYEGGKFIAAPAWIHGFEDARAGIMMKAKPQPKTPSYSQGWGPAFGWTDRGKVDQVGQKTKVPRGRLRGRAGDCRDQRIGTRRRSNSSISRVALATFVSAGAATEKKPRKHSSSTKVETLDAKGLAEIRAGALKMEKGAYQRSKNVYARTSPAEPAISSNGK